MRILLINDISYVNENLTSSSFVIKKFTDLLCQDEIIVLLLGKRNNKNKSNKSKIYFIPFFNFLKLLYKIFKKLNLLKIYGKIEYFLISSLISKKVIRVLEKEKIDKIWIYSHREGIVLLKSIIMKKNIPFHISIHDDILENPDFENFEKVKEDFKYLLGKADSCDFISGFMNEYYKKFLGTGNKSIPIWAGFIKKNRIVNNNFVSRNVSKIAFAGTMWTQEEHESFWKAIGKLNEEKNNNKKIEMDYYTQEFNQKRLNNDYEFLLYKGFLDNNLIPEVLSKYDALYLTMSFSSKFIRISETSFPSKIISYIEAGVPIIAHGPEYSSVVKFIRGHNIGICIKTLDSDEIAVQINEFSNNFNLREEIKKNIKIIQNELLFENNSSKFKEILMHIAKC